MFINEPIQDPEAQIEAGKFKNVQEIKIEKLLIIIRL